MKNIDTNFMSNLIVNMTVNHATEDEFSRAIRYSMAIVDLEKTYKENNMDELIEKYKGEN